MWEIAQLDGPVWETPESGLEGYWALPHTPGSHQTPTKPIKDGYSSAGAPRKIEISAPQGRKFGILVGLGSDPSMVGGGGGVPKGPVWEKLPGHGPVWEISPMSRTWWSLCQTEYCSKKKPIIN